MSTIGSEYGAGPGEDAVGPLTGAPHAWTYEEAWGLPENCLQDNLGRFRSVYLDYLEGCRSVPPSQDCLTDKERRLAAAFIKSTEEAAGFDPYVSRPSVEELVVKAIQNGYPEAAAAIARLEELLARDESFPTYARPARVGQRDVEESGER